MPINHDKIDEKYLNELYNRVTSRTWDLVIAGSSKKLKEALINNFKEIMAIRKMLIERKILILDKYLLKTDSPEFKRAMEKWLKEETEKSKKKEHVSKFKPLEIQARDE